MSKSWRDMAAPIIAGVIAEVGRSDIKALRKALRDAYPFGERKYHPYKVWCDEVQRQVGRDKVKQAARRQRNQAQDGSPPETQGSLL